MCFLVTDGKLALHGARVHVSWNLVSCQPVNIFLFIPLPLHAALSRCRRVGGVAELISSPEDSGVLFEPTAAALRARLLHPLQLGLPPTPTPAMAEHDAEATWLELIASLAAEAAQPPPPPQPAPNVANIHKKKLKSRRRRRRRRKWRNET